MARDQHVSGYGMKLTDKNMTFVLFFIPFLVLQCFAEWGTHGYRVRNPDYSEEPSDTSTDKNPELGTDSSTISSVGSTPGQIHDLKVEKSITDIGVPEFPEDTSSSDGKTLESNSSSFVPRVYNLSIVDYNGMITEDAVLLPGIKKFRGTVVPGGDTVHFRVPVYGDINLENIEFSGIVFNDPEITIATSEFENPYSFASGLWTTLSSLGGLATLGFATEPLLEVSSDRTETVLLLICGYIVAGAGHYFGVDKMVRHFRWNHQFGNR